jgi:PAS domain S-box-containing protein
MHDGTSARNLQLALKRSEAMFRRVFDEAPVGLARVDERRAFTRVNAALVRMLGYAAGELDAQPMSRAAHPQDLERDVTELAELNRRDAGVLARQKRYVRKDGSQGWADVGTIRLNDEDGGFIGNLVIIADITDSQHLRELEQLTKELRRSNEDLQQFAYIASHDLQEPLRAVSSCAALLAKRYRGRLDERADQFIDFTVEGAKRMQELIQDLLDFSRVGSSERPFAAVDLNEVLVKARLALKASIDESGAEIHNGQLPVVHGDRTMLAQVLQNLIGNAIKYRSDQPPRIRVEARQEDGLWDIAVADNGIGIAPEFHERIFDIFKRLHSRRKYAGNGVGLAICRKAIERHGGRVWVDSRDGTGSTFHFTVPGHGAHPRTSGSRSAFEAPREPVAEVP